MKTLLRSLKFPFVFLPKLGLVLLLLYVVGVIGCFKCFCPGGSKALVLIVFGCALCWPLLLVCSILVGLVYRFVGLVWFLFKRFNRFSDLVDVDATADATESIVILVCGDKLIWDEQRKEWC